MSTSTRDPIRTSRFPLWVTILLGLALIAAVIISIAGAIAVGTTWDEKVQMYMLQAFFDKGWHTGADIIDDVPDPRFYYGTFVYGPVGELLPHAVNVLLGHESWGTVSVTADAYTGRHIGTALWALLGVGAVGATVKVITRSWYWGLLGATMIAVTPLWIGHGMFNIKDTPAATGYTVATLGLVALCRPDYLVNRRIRAVGLISLVLGSVLAAGTRTALGVPIAASVPLAIGLMWLLARRQGRDTARELRASRRFVEGFVAMVAAYLILFAIYPKAYRDPIWLGIKSILDSALYPVTEAQLVNGVWMTQPVSWTYLPLWFGAQLPLLVLIGCAGFVAWWIWKVGVAVIRPSLSQRESAVLPMAIPVGLQLLLLPVATIAGKSTLYNGSRQMLFVVTAAAVLASLGVWLLTGAVARSGRRGLVPAIGAVVGVGLAAPLVSQVLLFPYGFTYFNALAAVRPIDGNWPTDYWRASGRELLTRVPSEGPESCGYEQLQKGRFMPCSEQPMFEPYLDARGSAAQPGVLGPNEYWFIRENNGVLDLPPGCRPFDAITRPLFWQTITIGQIAICDDRIDTGMRNMIDPSQPAT